MPSESNPLEFLTNLDSQVPQDEAGHVKYPTVAALLQPLWREGKCIRQSGRISLRVVGSYFLVTVSCPTEGVETTATLASIADVFEALESHVHHPGAVWTPTYDRIKAARQDEKKIRDELKRQAGHASTNGRKKKS